MSQQKIVYLMGPSGSGKDTLIHKIKTAAEFNFYIPTRYITRPCDCRHIELHHELTKEEFLEAEKKGFFAYYWQANDCYYGIDQSIYNKMESGQVVLINGSREHYLSIYQSSLVEVMGIYLHLSEETQRKRLKERNRDTDQLIKKRVTRNRFLESTFLENSHVISTEKSIDEVYLEFRNIMNISVYS